MSITAPVISGLTLQKSHVNHWGELTNPQKRFVGSSPPLMVQCPSNPRVACRANFPSVFATATEMECSDEPWREIGGANDE